MSADLIRRAAAKLREMARAATPGPWTNGPSEEQPGNAGVWDLHRITVTGKPGTDDVGNPWAPEVARIEYNANGFQFPHTEARNDAAFIALMHPPVALALADLLDGYAEWFDLPPFFDFKNANDERFITLARAILREEES